MERKTLDIMLTNKDEIQGNILCVIDEEVLDDLLKTSYEREKLYKRSLKLNEKKAKTVRHAQKLINQFANSRQITYDRENQAIGIYQGEIVYIVSLERLKNDPTVEPLETDEVRGKLTKSEKRLYQKTLSGYAFLNNQINDYLNDLTNNEIKLISFQTNVLKEKEYSVKNNYLIVSTVDGKVYLATKENVDENKEVEEVEEKTLSEEVVVDDRGN